MTNLQDLQTQQNNLLEAIREIEASYEGIENENNAKRIQELDIKQAQYSAQRQEMKAKLSELDKKISDINTEISKLSEKFLRL